jgi:hypothetical protein
LTTLASITGADNGFAETVFPVSAPPVVTEKNRKTSVIFFMTPPANKIYNHLTQIEWAGRSKPYFLRLPPQFAAAGVVSGKPIFEAMAAEEGSYSGSPMAVHGNHAAEWLFPQPGPSATGFRRWGGSKSHLRQKR